MKIASGYENIFLTCLNFLQMKKVIFIMTVITTLFVFSGCQKLNEFVNHDHPDKDTKAAATVALDWYRLELRMLLERNSALNGVYFGYLGIGLYEAVRSENKNSVSLSSKLNQMPLMPEADNKSYDWVISANAALASMFRVFNTGLTPANQASIDSLENAYNQNSTTNPDSDKFRRSQAFGRSVATAIYNWYLTDNYNASNLGYVPPVFPGAWEPRTHSSCFGQWHQSLCFLSPVVCFIQWLRCSASASLCLF
jgi:hypothetical protein